MAHLLEEAHWLYEKDVSSVLFPRSYNLSREPKAFLEDFRLTAAAGLLKWFVERMQDDPSFPDSGHRSIPMSRLEFAVKRCEEFIACENHQNIDEDFVAEFTEEEWNSFLDDYNAAVHEGAEVETGSEKGREQLQVPYSLLPYSSQPIGYGLTLVSGNVPIPLPSEFSFYTRIQLCPPNRVLPRTCVEIIETKRYSIL